MSNAISVQAVYYNGKNNLRHPVDLQIMANQLLLQSEDINLSFPLNELEISEALFNTPRIITMKDGAHCEVRDTNGFKRMLEAASINDSKVSKIQNRWSYAFYSLVFCVLVLIVSYLWILPKAANWLAYQIPPSWTQRMGVETMAVLDKTWFSKSKLDKSKQYEIYHSLDQMKYPNKLRPNFQLLFRDGGKMGANALALPDGTIVLTDQLVQLGSQDEVLAVLTHELGHLELRHSLKMLIESSAVGVVVAWYVGDVGGIAAAIPSSLINMHYSRDHEEDADRFAADMLKLNAKSPALLASILEKMQATQTKDEQVASDTAKPDSSSETSKDAEKTGIHHELIDKLNSYISSHPPTPERINSLKNM